MKSLFFIIILLTSCLLSCTGNKNKFDIEASNVYSLKGNKIVFQQLMSPRRLNMVGNNLIISENSRVAPELPLIHVINKTTLKYKFPKGITGFGPLEISDATLVEPGFSEGSFLVYSSMEKKFTEFSLNDTSKLGISQYKQSEAMFGMYSLFHASDSSVIGIMANDKNRLVEYSTITGNRIDGYGEWQKIPGADHLIDYYDPDINYHLGEINKGRFKADRKLGLFVKANAYIDRIEIFHYDTKTFDIVEGPRLEVPDFKVNYSNGRSAVTFDLDYPYGYGDVSITPNYIFALYGGNSPNKIRNTNEIAKTIYILNHTGNVLGKIALDISIVDMVVDEDLGKIYGITTDKDPGIAVFDLPERFKM